MEQKEMESMSKDLLIEMNKQMARTIENYSCAYRQLNAFRNIVQNSKALCLTSVSGAPFVDTKAFYDCVLEADKALGYISDPTL